MAAAVLFLVFTSVLPAPSQQYPRARLGEFEVHGFDIASNGGWRRIAARISAERRAALRGGALARLNSPIMAVKGRYFLPVVPIAFRGTALTFARHAYQQLLFDSVATSRPFSLRSFYAAASRGNVTLDGSVFDWVAVPNTASYYQDGCNGIGVFAPCPTRERSRMGELLLAALDSVSRGTDGATVWNRFDNDGPDGMPNSGDDDGVVDLVTFLQPSPDGACGTDGIWAHRYVIRGWAGGAYITRTPRRGPGGQPISGEYLHVDSYTMQSAVGGSSSCLATDIMPIGTVAHETGHAFALPDLYDTDRGGGTEGIGEWGLMSSGNYARPWSPASFEAWSLVQLGWVAVDTLASGRTISARAVQLADTVYHVTTDVPGVSLLLENRQAIGSDTAMMSPAFSRQKGPGLLIWRIDDARILGSLAGNTVNTGPRPGVALMQADGLDQLRSSGGARNRGDGGDPWPGTSGRTSFGLMSTPAAKNFDGTELGIRIDRIAATGDRVVFRMTRRSPTLIAAGSPHARITVDGTTTTRWREIAPAGDTLNVSVDSVQTTNRGRTVARFVRWSDAGAATRAVVLSSVRPDTLLAHFEVMHQLTVLASGGGSVSSTSAGGLGGGKFLAAGVVARLTATPHAGAEFVSWRGDTVTSSAVVDLLMSRPWSVVAEFVEPVAIAVADATRALLGGGTLSAAARAYLDVTGNRNGGFDVGDLLAWLRRTNQRVPPSLHSIRPSGS